MKVKNKWTIAVDPHSPTSSGASQEQPDPGQFIQLREDTSAETDGQAFPASQVVVLDPDAQCVLSEVSGVERRRNIFNNEGGASLTISLGKWRKASSNQLKIYNFYYKEGTKDIIGGLFIVVKDGELKNGEWGSERSG